ncbi:MAG: urease accessory protein UreF [Anaerovoracaceae bacterium]
MDNNKLFHILQLCGGNFPTGSFSQSWGLETYVAQGRMKTVEEFIIFLESYLDSQIARSECPLGIEAMRLAESSSWEKLSEVEQIARSMKLTKESREGSLRMGKALMRIATQIIDDEEMKRFYEDYKKKGISYSTAYGIVCGRLGLDKEEAFAAYIFSVVNGLVQSGIKLIPLGNTQAQSILLKTGAMMEKAIKIGLKLTMDQVSNFSPGFDIASIKHESLGVRLYMS